MKKIFFVILLTVFAHHLFAQQTAIYLDPEKNYQLGLELFNKQKYGAAQREFQLLLESRNAVSDESRTNAEFYIAFCAAELFHKDAEYLLSEFIRNHPESSKNGNAILELSNLFYRLKQHKKAILWFEKVDKSLISKEELPVYYFHVGYSYYMTGDYDKAIKAFNEVKDTDSKYASAATYYFAHMAYVNKNYETALQNFLKLKDSEAFGAVVPYYIAQIYYRQGKNEELLQYAPSIIDSSKTKNGLEISRMIAESYYRKGNYKDAIPYLAEYEKNSGAADRTDYYELGYSYYRTNECAKATPYFQKVTDKEDTIAQYAYYHLADCFIKTGNKKSARSAFQSAAKMNFDEQISEESQFNYAKLSYELSFQSVALEAFRKFIKAYPNSDHIAEANEALIDIYTTTKNYKDALTAIENMKDKSQNMKSAYQKVAFFRGVELFMDNNLKEAIGLFNTSISNPADQKLVAKARYWKGEAQYKLNNYDDAIQSYNDFVFTPSAVTMENYNLANYNLGYSYFKKGEYASAQTSFRKYIKEKPQTDNARYNDALLRIADSFFMLKDQNNAMEYYTMAIDNKSKSSDYALYQKAMIYGIQNKLKDKAATLQKIFDKYPKSVYFDDALYESGNASMLAGDNAKAQTNFRKLINEYPSSSYVKKAMLGEALLYFNNHEDEKAKSSFKSVIEKYPNTPESREALAQLKNVAVSQNKVDEYLDYVKTVPNADVSVSGQDSLIYESAELRYTQGNCEDAIKDFDNYMQKFSNGIFRVNATYYKADCQFRNKQYETALSGYEFVISQEKSAFTEKSLLNAGIINYRMKQYDKALQDFEKLESVAEVKDNIVAAQAGQMRCNYKLLMYDKTISSAQKIIESENSDKDLVNEAHLLKGKSALAKNDLETAKAELTIVSKRTNSEMTAEARYNLALIEYMLGNFKASEKIIQDIQKLIPTYDYWIAKGFILWGDNYIALKDTFQGKETYKSIVDNYQKNPDDPDDLKEIARQKLDAIKSEENRNKEMIEQKLKMNSSPQDSTEEK
jgi:TolA-binding protein